MPRHAQQSVPAQGWYPDPSGTDQLRWWDGAAWTNHLAPRPDAAPSPAVAEQSATAGQPGASEPASASAQADEADLGGDVPLFGARKFARKVQEENTRLRHTIDEYGLRDLAELDRLRDEQRTRMAHERETLQAGIDQARRDLAQQTQQLEQVRAQLVGARDAVTLEEVGLYRFAHPAESSVDLKRRLETVRYAIKNLTRTRQAIQATASFTFNDSAAKGRKFVSDMSKIMLRAYNAEAENCVKTVRAGNLPAAHKRLGQVVEQIARQGAMIQLRITPEYHRFRLEELDLAAEFLQRKEEEKEAERERRAELREQKKAQEELQREKERLLKEQAHYHNALEALLANGDEDGAQRLREKLADVEHAIADVDYRVANARAGYVYVISNIGAFGRNVVKIGMTRRLDPMDRVRELGDASVPFKFDVHALFFSADAVTLEAQLHQDFDQVKVNKVNGRKEFFHATPVEVLARLETHTAEVIEFTEEPEAEEYRISTGQPVDAF